jgi:hypothetical protein
MPEIQLWRVISRLFIYLETPHYFREKSISAIKFLIYILSTSFARNIFRSNKYLASNFRDVLITPRSACYCCRILNKIESRIL